MIRKIEDVKLNSKKILRTPSKNIKIEEAPKQDFVHISKSDFSKLNFLKKKEKEEVSSNHRISPTPKIISSRKSFNKGILGLFIVAIMVGIFYLLSTVFLKVNVTIIHKNKPFDLSHQGFIASKDNSIPFELMIIGDSENKNITLTSTIEASEKAKGKITLYNENSDKPEKIIAGTFISDENGKTYKTDTTVSIPGYTKDQSKVIAGQISVGITAFLVGEAYNGTPESFYINSFKNTTKYKKIYGKVETPLSGGIAGHVYVLNDQEKTSTLSDLSSFKDKLLRKLNAQVPSGYILYPDAVSFSYDPLDSITSKTPNTTVTINGTVSAFILKESILTDFIISKLLPDISSKEKMEILKPDLSKLSFNFATIGQTIDKNINNFNFELTGNLSLDWKPDTENLKASLVGKNKNEVDSILKSDPGISVAHVTIIPFWSSKLPLDSKNIKITVR